jgi:site-specific recombinase XerD
MSVYKPQKSPYYTYDFELDGRRFFGSTRSKSRSDAKEIEKKARAKARVDLDREQATGSAPMTIDVAAGRYWLEVGQHHAGATTTWANLDRLEKYFGPSKRLDEISDDDVAKLVAWRRAQTIKGRKSVRDPFDAKQSHPAPHVSPSTVNRSTTEVLQKICNRATRLWGVVLPKPPRWSEHMLEEPRERVREVRASEEDSFAAVRADYRPLVAFARAAGLRLSECLMKKTDVDLAGGRINVIGKGAKPISQPITDEMRMILMAEMANPTLYVFTYAAARACRRGGKVLYAKGERQPITKSGLKTTWRRSRHRKTGARLPADLRFHDLRHDFATKLLRETGNLKLVQRALHHSKIETTTRYAHVLDEEILAGMEAASKARKKR